MLSSQNGLYGLGHNHRPCSLYTIFFSMLGTLGFKQRNITSHSKQETGYGNLKKKSFKGWANWAQNFFKNGKTQQRIYRYLTYAEWNSWCVTPYDAMTNDKIYYLAPPQLSVIGTHPQTLTSGILFKLAPLLQGSCQHSCHFSCCPLFCQSLANRLYPP